MKKKVFTAAGIIMIIIAVIFVSVAFSHPEMSFPWSNTVTYIIYLIYAAVTVLMFFVGR